MNEKMDSQNSRTHKAQKDTHLGPAVLDQNYLDLNISFFAIQDQVIRLTFMPVFQSNIGLGWNFLNYCMSLENKKNCQALSNFL